MSLISRLLPPAHVAVDLDAADKRELFDKVARMLEPSVGIRHGAIAHSLETREALGSTALGHGIAVPHGRVKGLRDAVGAFVRTRAPLAFDAPDGAPVRLAFVLLVPERATDVHLQILSELAEMFSDRELRAQLIDCPDSAAAQRLIVQWEPHAPGHRRAAV